MCQGFSPIVMKNEDVLYVLGRTSHQAVIDKYNIRDTDAFRRNFAKLEFHPPSTGWEDLNTWEMVHDDGKPDWWEERHEAAARRALIRWAGEIAALAGARFEGDFEFRGLPIGMFPEGLTVGGSLNLSGTQITITPKLRKQVKGEIYK